MGALETAEGGPTRDQRPRKEQRSGAAFTHGHYSQLCLLCQVQPTTTSSGLPGREALPRLCPLLPSRISGPGHSFLPTDALTGQLNQRCSCPSTWAAPQPDSQPFTSPEPQHGALCQEARLGIEQVMWPLPSQAHMKANAESDSRGKTSRQNQFECQAVREALATQSVTALKSHGVQTRMLSLALLLASPCSCLQ